MSLNPYKSREEAAKLRKAASRPLSRRADVLCCMALCGVFAGGSAAEVGPSLSPDRLSREGIGRALSERVSAWVPASPDRLRLDRTLVGQKVTVANAAKVSLDTLRLNSAELLQCLWSSDPQDPERLVLKRHPFAVKEMHNRALAEAQLKDRARQEQKQRMLEGYRSTRKAVDGPNEEIYPGHWGRRGVPPRSEPLVKFLDTLNSTDWDRLCAEVQFLDAPSVGTNALVARDPIISWPFKKLSAAQQACVREYMESNTRGRVDYSKMAIFIANRNGTELNMGIYSGSWGEAALIYAIDGKSIRELKSLTEQPLFLPDGPTFTTSVPDALQDRERTHFELKWSKLDYAQACAKLGEVLQLGVLADYYTFGPETRLTLTGDRVSLPQVFSAFNRAFGCHFASRRGMLLLRRGDWRKLDRREISQDILEICEKKKRPGGGWRSLDTMTLAWLANVVTPEQIPCLGAFSSRDDRNIQFAPEASVLRGEYDLLRLMGALNATGRMRLTGQTGLSCVSAYQSAPTAYLAFMRNRAPWLLNNPAVSDGVMRVSATQTGQLVSGLPDAAPPMQFEIAYVDDGIRTTFSQVTGVPAIDSKPTPRQRSKTR